MSKELLVEARFPIVPARTGVAFSEISRRHGDFALVGVAAQLSLHETGTISAAHLALMGVAETPIRMHGAEALLLDQQPAEELFQAAADKACADLDAPTDLHASSEYRRSVAGVLVRHALHTATEQAMQRGER
jgi:carbon-monoxide dehydrogenase medium subunit